MRKKSQKQMPLTLAKVDHPHAMELDLIGRILGGKGTGGIALVVFQIQQIILDHVLRERIRRLLVVPRNFYDC